VVCSLEDEFLEVRRSGAWKALAYAARQCAKRHAANATTHAPTAIIEIASSVVTHHSFG
jgi:hypothetical protein